MCIFHSEHSISWSNSKEIRSLGVIINLVWERLCSFIFCFFRSQRNAWYMNFANVLTLWDGISLLRKMVETPILLCNIVSNVRSKVHIILLMEKLEFLIWLSNYISKHKQKWILEQYYFMSVFMLLYIDDISSINTLFIRKKILNMAINLTFLDVCSFL